MYVSCGTMDGSGRRPAWRDPVVFILLEALIEDGLGEVSQETIPQQRIRSAVKIYFLRHPHAAVDQLQTEPPKHPNKNKAVNSVAQAYGKIGGLTRAARMSSEQRQAVAMKGAMMRWHHNPEMSPA